jgi:hypothetical protein
MQHAVQETCARVEEILGQSHAFRRIEEGFYVVRQGSAYIHVHVIAWGGDRALVRFVAQLARDVEITPDLALALMRLNASLRFGSFGYVQDGACITLQHTLLGGSALTAAELLATLRDLALIADEYDDRIVAEVGGSTMQALLEEREMGTLRRVLVAEVATNFDGEPPQPRR